MSKNVVAISTDDRRSRRTEVSLVATIEAGPARTSSATVHNVSAHGLLVEVEACFVPGRPVTVELNGLGRVPGRIAWVREGHAGVAFATPLTLDQINAII